MNQVSDRSAQLDGRRLGVPLLFICLAVFIACPGCRIVRKTASVPERAVGVFFPGGKDNQPEPGELQESLMRYADGYIAQTTKSVDQLARGAGAPITRREALEFKLASTGSAISIATGENPYANLIDMVSMTMLTRKVLEDHTQEMTNGVAFEPWLRRSRRLETNVWSIADQVLKKEQQEQLRKSINDVYAATPDLHTTFLTRPQELTTALPRTLSSTTQGGSLFNLSGLDPFSGLDPAVREITESRLFAERAMYSIQRMPWLLRWQSEVLLLDIVGEPQVSQMLGDISRFSQSIDRASMAAESISRTASELPDRVSAEREALITALEKQEGELTVLVSAATELSDSLGRTITDTESLMERFGVGEPRPAGAVQTAKTNAKPFDILEYALAAEKATALARELDSVVSNLHATLESPALEKVTGQAASDVRRVLNHAFLLLGGLVLLVLVCALVYRVVAGRPPNRAGPGA
jgi:hypothetical protein